MPENKNSKARIAANNRYNAKAYDRINIAVPKGKKDEIKAAADQEGKSVNAFINEAIDEKMSGAGVQSIAQPAPPSDHDRQQEQGSSETD